MFEHDLGMANCKSNTNLLLLSVFPLVNHDRRLTFAPWNSSLATNFNSTLDQIRGWGDAQKTLYDEVRPKFIFYQPDHEVQHSLLKIMSRPRNND